MSGGGMVRRLTLFGALYLGFILFVACSGSASTAAPADARGVSGGDTQPGGVPAAGPTNAPAPGATSVDGSSTAGLYIIRTGTLAVEVADVDAAVAKGRDQVSSVGGYISASSESTKSDQHTATITYRIPVDRWQETITALRAIGTRVISEDTHADEVTSQIVDLNARIDNARVSEASLRDIMSRAGTITDVLAVQERLQSVQEDIERMVAQQQDLTGKAALGTLAVSWETPIVAAVAEMQSGWNLGHEVDHALAQTLNAGQALVSFLVWLVLVGVPVFGPILVIGLIVIWYARRYQRRHPRPTYPGWDRVGSGPAGWYPSAGPAAPPQSGQAPAPGDEEPPPGA